ncbi:uncharacterized protein YlxW (UPF0749 family) [Chryseomicrobium aureum]|uniref:DUF881 domain-containing protein n=1 Tax=Chryseomicrobium aureum TaxID=1441723 RepID=UPI001958E190|nr:DUF881 domain-containing protein [Chryseomicrobium aureum]MBM7705330.1 uncharacterized protein YlxW (UPF0749 family) [Chryseomicrobium aureum]
MNNKKTNRGKILLSLVSLTLGFILAFSYSLSQQRSAEQVDLITFNQTEEVREQLIQQKERNKELSEELQAVQTKIREYEQQAGSNTSSLEELVKTAEALRLLTGEVAVKGPGYKVELQDGEYDPNQVNPNDYIVHEGHVYMVINELKIAGAEAISVNGKRIHETSYIRCTGPVITVDGETFPAPFVIEAIGNPETLADAAELSGGILDQLRTEQIRIETQKLSELVMQSMHSGS